MRTQWYGDKRDLVKWGTLIHLCKTEGIETIIQVPFLREQEFSHELVVETEAVPFPKAVWDHFRDLKHIALLGSRSGLTIEVFPLAFNHSHRGVYIAELCARISRMNAEPKVVFLDPDTGLEPRKASANHVTIDEIETVWKNLQPRDWLVLYQHSLRKTSWENSQRKRFQNACGRSKVKTFHCKDMAHDVVFFAASKT